VSAILNLTSSVGYGSLEAPALQLGRANGIDPQTVERRAHARHRQRLTGSIAAFVSCRCEELRGVAPALIAAVGKANSHHVSPWPVTASAGADAEPVGCAVRRFISSSAAPMIACRRLASHGSSQKFHAPRAQLNV
jgi:hypothetical protein